MLLLTWSVIGSLAPAVAAVALGTLRRTRARWKFNQYTGHRRGWLYYVLPLSTYGLCVSIAAIAFTSWLDQLRSQDEALLGLLIGLVALAAHARLALGFFRRQYRTYL